MKSAALLEATRAAGSVTKLAALLGVAPQAISQWRQPPATRVLAIERVTGVSRHDLRPDLYPLESPSPKRRAKQRAPAEDPPSSQEEAA